MDLHLGGEVYEEVSIFAALTPAYDFYVQQILIDAGVTELLLEREKLPEDQRQPAARIFMRQIANTGNLAPLIAAFLQPKGGGWSPQWAVATAKKIDKLTVPVERKLVMAIFYKGINDFFQHGRRLSKTSH
jgi:hypothetical protein